MKQQPMHSPTDPLVTLHDARGRILHAGPLYSYSSNDILQTAPWDWVDLDEDKQKIRDAYQQVLFDQRPTTCRIEITLKDGSKAKYECRATPVDAGDVVAIVSSVAIVEDESANLTDRELELLRYLVAGRPTKQIAKQMGVKPTTVATYKARIKEKLGVDSLAGLINYATKHLR
jgi:DNA-binding CsgD family transcriptional regulator